MLRAEKSRLEESAQKARSRVLVPWRLRSTAPLQALSDKTASLHEAERSLQQRVLHVEELQREKCVPGCGSLSRAR
jgi:hypothetical protein